MLFAALAASGQFAAPALASVALAAFAAVLIWAATVDAGRRIIPNAAIAAGCAAWFVLLLAAELSGIDVREAAARGLASGLLLVAGLLVFSVVFERMVGRSSMGGGDIKLIAMSGLYLGLSASLAALMVSCVLALAFEAVRTKWHSGLRAETSFAFGPYIAVASCAVAVCELMLAVL